jgi:hypothetical protein
MQRTYGRVYPRDVNGAIIPNSVGVWVEVQTDAQGFNDAVMLTTLCQVIQLNLNESPFYSNYGIPAKESVQQQIAPDFWLTQIQQQFSPFFASLVLAKVDQPTPQYIINCITSQGARITQAIAV